MTRDHHFGQAWNQGHDEAPIVIDRILQSRELIAVGLADVAAESAGPTANRLNTLSAWFQQPRTSNDVLHHPDALVVCSHLIAHQHANMEIDPAEVRSAGQATFDTLRLRLEANYRLLPKLTYPLVLIVLSFAMFVVASIYLVPDFQNMFDEFGLDLSLATKISISLAASLRRWWVFGAVTMALLGVLLIVILLPGKTLPSWTPVIRIPSLGLRKAWAQWAWHTGWLLKIGVVPSRAVAIAGSNSAERWLRRNSVQWSEQMASGGKPFSQRPVAHWQPYGLLAYAFELEDRNDQSELLHAYATIHQEQKLQRQLWWISWITPAILVLVASLVGLFVTAFFAPLADLISGLT